MILNPHASSCTLDDSTRLFSHFVIYAHHLKNPNAETRSLVFITNQTELRALQKQFEDILHSYTSAARDGEPIIACQHYCAFASLQEDISHFVNEATIGSLPERERTQFAGTHFQVRQASKNARDLLTANKIRQGWQELDDLLIYMPQITPYDPLRRTLPRGDEPETFKQTLRMMKKNYRQMYY